jgi:hypothetical protein
MADNGYLRDLIVSIKKTEEMIALHKNNHTPSITANQYELIKAKQIAELIDGLTAPAYQTLEAISVIKHILDRFYPDLPFNLATQEDLRDLENAI